MSTDAADATDTPGAIEPATQRWRTLVIVYPVLDAGLGSGLARRRAQRVMGREERAAVEAVIERLPATILAWSEGLARLDPLDVVEVRRPIKGLSSVGNGRWWLGPREVRPELESVVGTGAVIDSVIALWPGDPSIPQCGWGCSIGPSEATFGAGFSSISSEHWPTLATDPDPEQGYVHEWLHQVEAVYRELGVTEAELPSLHDAGAFTSWRGRDVPPFGRSFAAYHDGEGSAAGARTWAPWYRDWMTGRLREIDDRAAAVAAAAVDAKADAGAAKAVDARADASADGRRPPAPIGLTPERWALRRER